MTQAMETPNYHIPRDIVLPDDNQRPITEYMLLGLQHVVAMFGATVLAPILMGFDPNVSVLFSGVATLLFYAAVGGKIPSYLGSSFSFIAAVGAATGYTFQGPNPNVSIALGGIIAAGLLYFLIGLLVKFIGARAIERIFPGVLTGAIVAVIGLNLAQVAVKQISGGVFQAAFGMVTILIVCVCNVYLPKNLARLPILIGGLICYGLYFLATNVGKLGTPIDFTAFQAAAILGYPKFVYPVFDWTAISLIAPVAIILVAENLGHVRAVGAMCERNLDPYLWRAFAADGLATMISGFFGGTGVTTYAENIGVMSMSKNFSSLSMVFAGVFAIFLGFSPKFGALIQTLPVPMLGGLSFILFGMITAAAGRLWVKHVDYDNPAHTLALGVPIIMGAGDFTIKVGSFAFGGISTATVTALVLYHLLNSFHRPNDSADTMMIE